MCQAYPKDTQYGESLVVKANPPLRSDSKFNHVLIFCNGISTNFSKLPINKRKISILRIISFVTCYSKIEKKPPIIRFLVSSKLSNETIQVIHLCSKKIFTLSSTINRIFYLHENKIKITTVLVPLPPFHVIVQTRKTIQGVMELPIGNDRGTEKSDERGERKKQLSPRTLSNAPPPPFPLQRSREIAGNSKVSFA